MDKLSQSAKELLAINILKEFGIFDEAIRIAKEDKDGVQDLKLLPTKSIDYLEERMLKAIEMIDEDDSEQATSSRRNNLS